MGALPRIPEEEEKSCLGSTNGSLGVSSTCWREEERRSSTSRDEEWSRLRGKVIEEKSSRQNRAATLLKWENPYWSSSNSSLLTINNQDTSLSTCHPQTKRSFERHKLHGCAATSDPSTFTRRSTSGRVATPNMRVTRVMWTKTTRRRRSRS